MEKKTPEASGSLRSSHGRGGRVATAVEGEIQIVELLLNDLLPFPGVPTAFSSSVGSQRTSGADCFRI